MTDLALNTQMGDSGPVQPASRPKLDHGLNPLTTILFLGVLAAGLLFMAYSIYDDIGATGTRSRPSCPFSCSAWRC